MGEVGADHRRHPDQSFAEPRLVFGLQLGNQAAPDAVAEIPGIVVLRIVFPGETAQRGHLTGL